MPAPAVWNIAYNGTTKPVAAWGIKLPRLLTRNLSIDTLNFRVARSTITADTGIFTPGSKLVLTRDGVPAFAGFITAAVTYFDGATGEQGEDYTVSGPWWNFERTPYLQVRGIATIVSGVVTGTVNQKTSRVVLNQDVNGNRLTNSAALSAVLTYAFLQGLPFLAGTISTLPEQALDEARDIFIAEAVKRLLLLSPDAVAWFDYSSAVPIFNVQVRSTLPAVTINLASANLVEAFDLRPRNDLVPTGVVFNFVKSVEVDDTTAGTSAFYDDITVDSAGATEGEGVIVATVELVKNAAGTYETAPTGLALAYYTALSTLQWEGTLRLHAYDVTDTVNVGTVLNLTGGRSAWSSMNAVVQTVRRELNTGVTEIEFGPPDHLSPQDFVNTIMFNRRNFVGPSKTDFPTKQPKDVTTGGGGGGGGTTPNPNGGRTPAPGGGRNGNGRTADIAVCNTTTGMTETVTVLVP